jgi:hypothetical protein
MRASTRFHHGCQMTLQPSHSDKLTDEQCALVDRVLRTLSSQDLMQLVREIEKEIVHNDVVLLSDFRKNPHQ